MKKYLLTSLMILGCCACQPSHVGLKLGHEMVIHEHINPIHNPKVETTLDWNL